MTEYNEPEAILSDPNLTPKARRELLERWELDLRQHLQAGDENMLGKPGTGSEEADLLQRVHVCLREITDADPDASDPSAAARVAGLGPVFLGVP